uniref:Uncharacterized protein n=1 Tax=Parascaris univalens TaxID=6257 RepID=A0A914ZQH7_PARUN
GFMNVAAKATDYFHDLVTATRMTHVTEASDMIGILNCGGDQADEFYSSGRRSSLYGKIRNSSRTVSYGTGGRIFIDGQPVRRNTTEEMWNELLKLILTHNALENALRGRVFAIQCRNFHEAEECDTPARIE